MRLKLQLSDQEFHVLKALFSDYRTYKRGLRRLMLIGFYVSLIGIGLTWFTLLIISGEFLLDVNLIIALLILLLYLIFTWFIWNIIKRNARKLETKLDELQITADELEQMVKQDIVEKLGL